jgi:hypothetical protein
MRKGVLCLTGLLLLVIAMSGCVSQPAGEGGPQIVEVGFTEGVKYTYTMEYADTNDTAIAELYVTDETPLYWEGIVTMSGELESDGERHKVANLARFRISKENFWVGMTGRLDLQEVVRKDHLLDKFMENDISKPFFLMSFVRMGGLDVAELLEKGEADFSANSWTYTMEMEGPLAVDDFLGYKVETVDFPTKYTFYVSAGEPYLLVHMNQGGLLMSLRNIEMKGFDPSEWEDYVLFLEYTTFNRSECADYLSKEEAEELLGAEVVISSSSEGDLETDQVANLVCVYDSESEHIAMILERFQTGEGALERYGGFLEALNASASITWEETEEFGVRSLSYTGGVTNDIRFISDIDPAFMVTIASQRESVAKAAAGKVEGMIELKE